MRGRASRTMRRRRRRRTGSRHSQGRPINMPMRGGCSGLPRQTKGGVPACSIPRRLAMAARVEGCPFESHLASSPYPLYQCNLP